jgi:hypothetical protein
MKVARHRQTAAVPVYLQQQQQVTDRRAGDCRHIGKAFSEVWRKMTYTPLQLLLLLLLPCWWSLL